MEDDNQLKWDLRFLDIAATVASWSKDPSTKCGAVIVRPDRTLCSVGYNGFPRGCNDSPLIYANRTIKYERVVHAELNAILSAREPVHGYTLYSWPAGWGPSCARCAAHIVQAGIKRVVHLRPRTDADIDSRWKESMDIGLQMFEEAGVVVDHLPQENYFV